MAGSVSLRRKERVTVTGAAITSGALIGFSRITGIIRDIGRTTLFGRDWNTDAYVSAFSIPDLIYFLASGGALSAGFIPIFTGYLTKGEDEKAIKTFRVLMTYLGLFLLALVITFEVFAPQLVTFLFPGMVGDAKKFDLTVRLVRILLPAQFFFVLGSLFTGALFSLHYFVPPLLQSSLYNLFILIGGIIGALLGRDWLGQGVEGMAVGALTGAILGVTLLQVWTLWRVGMDFRPCFDWRDEGARQVVKLIVPVVFSLAVTQINAIILPRSFSSFLPDGAATAVEMANRIMQLPVALFGASVGLALFPTLSALATEEAMSALRRQILQGVRTVLTLTVPSAVLMGVLREPIVSVLFQYGRWTVTDTEATALALLFYSIGVPAMALQQVLGRGFYALRDTWTPVWVGFVSFGTAFCLNALLVHSPLQQGGLALAFSASAWLSCGLLSLLLWKRLRGKEWQELISFLMPLMGAAIGMGFITQFSLSFLPPDGWIGRLGYLLIPSGLGAFIYLVTLKVFGVSEAQFFRGMRRRRNFGGTK